MDIYTSVCARTYTHTYVCIFLKAVCLGGIMLTCVCVHVSMRMCACIYVYVCMFHSEMYTDIHTFMHMCAKKEIINKLAVAIQID